ncbi:hypothetical protein AKG34_13350 [Peribacillus butanolivorans]|uniref:hypothetical protein n=1 Tax=Peribacillus butanolivorans TaxID=421767 RepID=UPI0006A6B687|nr:hypothetical protein [Peribacillus butanolivorans]KON69635.1 hypothetical protein AKG34_13350 [Peribacillus butanolivorans]
MVFDQGMSLNDVDNMEVKYYLELINFRANKIKEEQKVEEKVKGKLITEGRFAGQRLSNEHLSLGR